MKRNHLIALAIFVGLGIVLSALLTIFVMPGGAGGALAPSANVDAETLRVAKGLYCPVCPGVPLDVCDTQACEQWRALIKQRLSEGQSAEQIQAYFVEQYGERVLGAPRAQGLNLLIYILPAFVLSAGGAFLFLFVQHQQAFLAAPAPALGAGSATTNPPSPVSNPYRSRIERELNEND